MPELIPFNQSAFERQGEPIETPEQSAARIASTPFDQLGVEGQLFLMSASSEGLDALARAASEQGNPGMIAAAGGAAAVSLVTAKLENDRDQAVQLQELILDTQRLFAQTQNSGQQG